MLEGFPARDHLREAFMLRDGSSRSDGFVRASRIVIPRAYISVPFDGNFLRARLTYPYFSGFRISGAIHRVVPPALLPGPSRELVSSVIAASPKSAKQARQSELMRIFAFVQHQLLGRHDLASGPGKNDHSPL
jgi:hypothetical protein